MRAAWDGLGLAGPARVGLLRDEVRREQSARPFAIQGTEVLVPDHHDAAAGAVHGVHHALDVIGRGGP